VEYVRWLILVAALLSVSACTAAPQASSTTPPSPTATASRTASRPASPTGTTPGRPDHVLIVVFENKTYDQVVGSSQAPYLNSLLPHALLLTDSHGVSHPSQPNYLALFSGSTHGVTSDSCPVRLGNTPNLGRQLLDAGLSFTAFSEDLPQAGFQGCSSDDSYAAKHAPWTAFGNLPASINQPATAFPSNYANLPTVSFLIPNLCNDMHNCPVATGDAWASTHLGPYLSWADQHNSLLIVTFDEDNGPGDHILTFIAGSNVHSGQFTKAVSHYGVLATVEHLYGLTPLGQAAGQTPIPLS
jgi:hypothetical protein